MLDHRSGSRHADAATATGPHIDRGGRFLDGRQLASPRARPWTPAQRPNGRVRLVALSAVCTALLAVVAILILSLHRAAAHAAVRIPAPPYLHRALAHRIVAPSRSTSVNARRYDRSLGGAPVDSLPFPPDPADRAPRPGEVPSLYADGLYCSISCRPYGAGIGWPLKPFHRQHPIRAGLNELRPASLHVGLDFRLPTARRCMHSSARYGCFATREVCVPRWVYRLAGGFAPPLPALLTPGRYRLTIYGLGLGG